MEQEFVGTIVELQLEEPESKIIITEHGLCNEIFVSNSILQMMIACDKWAKRAEDLLRRQLLIKENGHFALVPKDAKLILQPIVIDEETGKQIKLTYF